LILLLLVFGIATADAAPAPRVEDAEGLVDQLIDRALLSQVRGSWLQKYVRDADPRQNEARMARRAEREYAERLAPKGDLYDRFVRSPGIFGSTKGPDYVRVVLEGSGWDTVVVGTHNGRPQIWSFEKSSCGLCSEPERFLRDLFLEVNIAGDATHRLLPGLELLVTSVHKGNPGKRTQWIWAYFNRAAGAEYTTRMLRNAQVQDSQGRRVQVRLASGEETWSLAYAKERWWVDYETLSPNSVLRLQTADASKWIKPKTVRSARVQGWEPEWRRHAKGVEITDGALFVGLREAQEEVLIYDQDMGRRWAMWAAMDPNDGRVLARTNAPRLPRKMFVDTIDWPNLFRFRLAKNGQRLAVAAHDRLWVFELFGEYKVIEKRGFSGAAGLSFSPDGKTLAVLDRSYGRLSLLDTETYTVRREGSGPRKVTDMLWLPEGFLTVTRTSLNFQSHDELKKIQTLDLACSAAKPTLSRLEGRAETWVYCPAQQTRLLRIHQLKPTQIAGSIVLEGQRKSGGFAVDPTGKWLVVPASEQAEDGMCVVDALTGDERACFAQLALRQVIFSADGSTIYGIDRRGRAWSWRLVDLLREQ